MDNQQERFELELAWLAGILEGEGWVSLIYYKANQKNGKYTPALGTNMGVTNCDKRIIDKVRNIFDRLKITYRYQIREAHIASDNSPRKEKYEISLIAHNSVKTLIYALRPFMIGEKKDRMDKLLEFLDIREKKGKSGPKSKYGKEEFLLYKEMYSYKGKSRSKILNDLTLDEIIKNFEDKV